MEENKQKSWIEFSDVAIKKHDNVVFEHLNFILNPGELLYLAGASSEASNLLISSFYAHADVEGKKAEILDYDLLDISREEITDLRQNVGLVLRDYYLYENLTFKENLEKFKDIFIEISDANIDVDLSEWLKSFGLNPDITSADAEDGDEILYSVAKALMFAPKILLVEDHFSHLRMENQIRIMNHLTERIENGSLSAVMVQSNSEFIERYPGIIYMLDEQTTKVS